MKPSKILLATAAVLAGAACNAENARDNTAGNGTPVAAVEPPANGDWSEVVTQTPQGGYLMGNPNADVKLVEFASMTCPHCAEFAETGFDPMVQNYVKSGRVAFELRNFVRDPLDITMALIARCPGVERFYPLTDAMFANQEQFFEQMQAIPAAQQQELAQLPPQQQFVRLAEMSGLQRWAAQRGVPSALQQQCLTNQQEIDRLVQMTADATSEYPNLPGTPAFAINGELVEQAASWQALEPKLREAIGG